mmetsp:Transcript_7855/g.22471  ORF Transcript_7855/g.22471 Transcript_7855/m.22471 type:complete len:527 (+) Transcript_7855:553-2133(+)
MRQCGRGPGEQPGQAACRRRGCRPRRACARQLRRGAGSGEERGDAPLEVHGLLSGAAPRQPRHRRHGEQDAHRRGGIGSRRRAIGALRGGARPAGGPRGDDAVSFEGRRVARARRREEARHAGAADRVGQILPATRPQPLRPLGLERVLARVPDDVGLEPRQRLRCAAASRVPQPRRRQVGRGRVGGAGRLHGGSRAPGALPDPLRRAARRGRYARGVLRGAGPGPLRPPGLRGVRPHVPGRPGPRRGGRSPRHRLPRPRPRRLWPHLLRGVLGLRPRGGPAGASESGRAGHGGAERQEQRYRPRDGVGCGSLARGVAILVAPWVASVRGKRRRRDAWILPVAWGLLEDLAPPERCLEWRAADRPHSAPRRARVAVGACREPGRPVRWLRAAVRRRAEADALRERAGRSGVDGRLSVHLDAADVAQPLAEDERSHLPPEPPDRRLPEGAERPLANHEGAGVQAAGDRRGGPLVELKDFAEEPGVRRGPRALGPRRRPRKADAGGPRAARRPRGPDAGLDEGGRVER